MGFGRKVKDRGRAEATQEFAHARRIGNVGLGEAVAGVIREISQRGECAGICQLVDVEHLSVGVRHQMPAHGRPEKAGAACDENAKECVHD
jgi:hypothetical protein